MTEATVQPPRVNRSIDIKTLPLRPEEAFVFSRVDGQALPREIALTTGMSTDEVEQALDRLSELGALEGWRVRRAPPREPQIHATQPVAPAQAPNPNRPNARRHAPHQPAPLEEGFVPVPDLDISATEQQRVWRLWKRLAHSNHYELLGLPRSASREHIRSAYFEQVSAFHPDKHFGKTLGTYKEKLEAVFQRLTQAHDTLSRTRRREQYDAGLPPAEPHEPNAPTPASVTPSSDGSEKQERTAASACGSTGADVPAPASDSPNDSSAGRNAAAPSSPQVSATPKLQSAPAPEVPSSTAAAEQRRQMAIRSLERGMRSMGGGQPQPPRPSAPSRRSPSGAPPPSSRSLLLERARDAERSGDFESAAASYEKAAAAKKDAALFAKAAECLEHLATGASAGRAALWKRAAESARQAVSLAPTNAQLRLVLSRVYAGAGMRASATREAEKAQELSPSEKSVQSWLERLRRGDV